jgi:DNA-binding transcriptional MerR regulator
MIQLPNKSHFKADEVCGFTGVKPYVLRFWETEFDQIKPVVSSSGQKLYEQSDVEAIMLVKKFLFDEKMTVEQARAQMNMQAEISTDENEKVEIEASTQLRGLDGEELQKLNVAKQKLSELVSLTQALQERHHWHQ